jgi:hypothetical protein
MTLMPAAFGHVQMSDAAFSIVQRNVVMGRRLLKPMA